MLDVEKEDFEYSFSKIQEDVHLLAKQKGFWDGLTPESVNKSEKLMLMVCELAEACEAERKGNPPDDKIPEFSSIETELADAVIRIMDFAQFFGYRLSEAILAKHEFNKSRPYKHGKAF